MAEVDQTLPKGERIRKALRWISETQNEYPEKERMTVIREAHVRFNLTPNECEFLEKNFSAV